MSLKSNAKGGRLTSSRDIDTVCTLAITYSLRLIQREAAGIPMAASWIMRVAAVAGRWSEWRIQKKTWRKDVQMSHQTGAGFKALLCHTIELTNWFKQARAVHIIK